MNCPICQKKMEKVLFHGVEIDYCPDCMGIWFEKGELYDAKDEKEETLKWLDVDFGIKKKISVYQKKESVVLPATFLFMK